MCVFAIFSAIHIISSYGTANEPADKDGHKSVSPRTDLQSYWMEGANMALCCLCFVSRWKGSQSRCIHRDIWNLATWLDREAVHDVHTNCHLLLRPAWTSVFPRFPRVRLLLFQHLPSSICQPCVGDEKNELQVWFDKWDYGLAKTGVVFPRGSIGPPRHDGEHDPNVRALPSPKPDPDACLLASSPLQPVPKRLFYLCKFQPVFWKSSCPAISFSCWICPHCKVKL